MGPKPSHKCPYKRGTEVGLTQNKRRRQHDCRDGEQMGAM